MSDMKKSFHYNSLLRIISIIAILANMPIASGQTGNKQHYQIPEPVNKIFQTSCMSCHGSNGGRFPKSRLNFSRWEGYGESKEAEKASSICSAVRKGIMPPKSARESKPELIPTKEQVDLICKWSEELKFKIKKE
jgi:mono/diheme cytochrome c family protein